ncbi:MAG: hypothetical protein WDM78_07550 [Puia sp.]
MLTFVIFLEELAYVKEVGRNTSFSNTWMSIYNRAQLLFKYI